MSELGSTIVRLLRVAFRGRRFKLCIWCRGNPRLAEEVLAEGHKSIVVGDKFRTLFALHERLGGIGSRPITIVEAHLDAIPVRQSSLDAIVLCCGLPAGAPAVDRLAQLRGFLVPDGLLIWPHPIIDGTRGKFGRILVPVRRGVAPPAKRHRLCAWTMEAGFRNVGQQPASGGPVPWVVTTGVAGRLNW